MFIVFLNKVNRIKIKFQMKLIKIINKVNCLKEGH